MVTLLSGMRFAQTGEGKTRTLAVLPVGIFKTEKYGRIDLSEKVCDQIIAAFADGIPRNGVFIDVDHDFGKARGWITSLGYGTYVADDGTEKPAVVAEVDYTTEGEQMLSDSEYRGISSAFGPHLDPETGKKYPNVLRAVSLTNMPVFTMLPEPLSESIKMLGETPELVLLGEELRMGMKERIGKMFAGLKFGEVADEAAKQRAAYPEAELEAAGWGVRDATAAVERLVRQAISEGMEGEALKARIEELAADLSLAVIESIQASVESARERIDEGAAEAEPVDPTEGTSEGTLAAEDHGDASAGGDNDMTEEQVKLAEAERDDALAKLAEYQRKDREDRIDALLDDWSSKGLAEASRNRIREVLTSNGMVTLSEGVEVDRDEALLIVLSESEWVPVTSPGAGGAQEPPASGTSLSAEAEAAKQKFDTQLGMTAT